MGYTLKRFKLQAYDMHRFFDTAPNTKIKRICERAKNYAQSQIVKGSTQLDNSKLSKEKREHLIKGIELKSSIAEYKNTTLSDWQGVGIRDFIIEQAKLRCNDGESETLALYHAIIAFTSKYSLGNCRELAIQALRYIIEIEPSLEAEVYGIKGGDHSFLVVNRNPFSTKAEDPETWGDAFICDPWANEVYPASEYATKLKNLYWDKDEDCFKTEPYDSSKHFLMPSMFNTYQIRDEICKFECSKKLK